MKNPDEGSCGKMSPKVRFAPLRRRWTFDAPNMNNKSFASHDENLTELIRIRNETSNNDIVHAKRNLHKVTMTEDLKSEIVNTILQAKPNVLINLGMSLSAIRTEIDSFVSKHFMELPDRYALTVDADSAIQNMLLLVTARDTKSHAVRCSISTTDPNVHSITITCPDRPKVYNRITLALDKVASNILEADIMSSTDGLVSTYTHAVKATNMLYTIY